MKSEHPEINTLGKFLSLYNEESDRGKVLMAASIIDEWLGEILNNFLVQDKVTKELLFGFNAPIGTFSAKTKMTLALGLIEKQEYIEINLIRKIRNEFGHNWEGTSFLSSTIIKDCNKLPWYGPDYDDKKITTLEHFNHAVVRTLTNLLWRKRLVKQNQLKLKSWPNK